mmetsp:Transcript_19332/g.21896  ORF Transcript_19332/g.21896 Transcript_19332/m.21896 type:complete len:460 (+) Transcript_19332:69-1448(+)
MTKTIANKAKGHRVADPKYLVRFYEPLFFGLKDSEEGEIPPQEKKTVKLPVKITSDGDDSRSNVTNQEIKMISHFDGNVEGVLESLSQLQELVIKPRMLSEIGEELRVTMQLMSILCTGPAAQTFQEATKAARNHAYDTYLKEYDEDDEMHKQIITAENNALFQYLSTTNFEGIDEEQFADSDALVKHVFEDFKYTFWNNLFAVIFGADAHRAYEIQKEYMTHEIVKPFGISIEQAFRRIDVMVKLLEYFPPTSNKGKSATHQQWERFLKKRVVSDAEKRKMKYKLLPQGCRDRFDSLQGDWEDMTDPEFLSESQKWETIEARAQQRKEAAKRKKPDDDSVSTLSRSQKEKNSQHKKTKSNQSRNAAGTARFCELCKLAGAPEWVWKNHNTKDCKKREQYTKSLSGSVGSRYEATKSIQNNQKKLKREIKSLQKQLKKTKVSNKKKDDDSDSDSTNVSY